MLFGHDKLISIFKKLVDKDGLSHAYLFFGESSLGKFPFAKSLANYIENKVFDVPERDLSETLIIDFSSQKEGENMESLGIDSIRRMERFIFQKPALSSRRIVIIRDAEWLTEYAQNALLKILEEPPQNGLILAIANNIDVFLSPVASRFQKVYFGKIGEDQMLDFVGQYGIIRPNKNELSQFDGRPGKVIEAEEIKSIRPEIRKKLLPFFSKKSKDRADAKKTSEEFFEMIDKNPLTEDLLFEEITNLVRESDKIKNSSLINQIFETITEVKTLNTNKGLQIKKILWKIKSIS